MNIGIICGGFGDEREISLKSSESIFKTLSKGDNQVYCHDPVLFKQDVRDKAIFSNSDSLNMNLNKAESYWKCFQDFKENAR